MKALITLPTDTLGGAEKKLKLIATELASQGWEIDVLFLKKRQDKGWDDLKNQVNLHFSSFTKERFGYFFFFRMLIQLSFFRPYDLTVASNTGLNGLLGLFKKVGLFKTKKLVVRESTLIMDRFSGMKRRMFELLYNWGYSATDLVICQTTLMKQRLLETVPISKEWRIKVIPNPIDLSELTSKVKSKVDLPFDKTSPYIMSAGRLIPLKGYHHLIKCFAELPVNYQLVILGQGSEKESLLQLSSTFGVANRVHLLGFKNNPYPYMQQARLCVVSSLIEGFPNTLLQMIALNNRVVSTTCAGDIDKLDGVITCPPDDEVGLKAAMQQALKLDEASCLSNRSLFDKELTQRSPKSFMAEIFKYING